MTEISQLKQTEKDAIKLAEMNGVVFAGRNHAPRSLPLDEKVRLERVHHATLTSMIKKGLLVKTFGSDGGYAAKLPK